MGESYSISSTSQEFNDESSSNTDDEQFFSPESKANNAMTTVQKNRGQGHHNNQDTGKMGILNLNR